MAKYVVNDTDLTSVANAIRTKGGMPPDELLVFPTEFVTTIDAIKGGGALYTNHADNSDFTRFVAQEGVGGKHGTQAYAGDRWVLVSGTVTGTANTDGDGYSNITLNGTLVQVVPSPPAVATPFIEMVSGTATIEYDESKGEIIITSSGGVIKNVLLLEGEWTEKPEYVAKGYAAEMDACQRYFVSIGMLHTMGFLTSSSKAYMMLIPLPVVMRALPVADSGMTWYARIATGGYCKHTSSNYTAVTNLTVLQFGNVIEIYDTISESAGDTNNSLMEFTIRNIKLSADLTRR